MVEDFGMVLTSAPMKAGFQRVRMTIKTKIEIIRHREVSAVSLRKIADLTDREFVNVPIVRETIWAEPDWTVILF